MKPVPSASDTVTTQQMLDEHGAWSRRKPVNGAGKNGQQPAPSRRLHVGFVLTALAGGGAERVTLTLADCLIRRGHRVDLLLLRPFGSYRASIPRGVHLYYLPAKWPDGKLLRSCRARGIPVRRLWVTPPAIVRTWSALRRNHPQASFRFRAALKEVLCVAGIARYLRAAEPRLLYGTSLWCNLGTIAAAKLVAPGVATVISRHLAAYSETEAAYTIYSEAEVARARALYPAADAVVAVSRGVGAETERLLGVPGARVHTLFNPIPVADIRRLSRQEVTHPWFGAAEVPVLLSIGRPTPQKDHATLVAAFGRIRRQRRVRLVIMGDSSASYRAGLRAAAAAFGAERELDFLDFDENPYRYLRRAAVLVLSSRYEGMPTVLIEALACGTDVVSTDAPYGPAEILGGGRWGKLMPMGNSAALADAVLAVLNGDTVPAAELRRRADDFAADRVAAAYEALFEQVTASRRLRAADSPGT